MSIHRHCLIRETGKGGMGNSKQQPDVIPCTECCVDAKRRAEAQAGQGPGRGQRQAVVTMRGWKGEERYRGLLYPWGPNKKSIKILPNGGGRAQIRK